MVPVVGSAANVPSKLAVAVSKEYPVPKICLPSVRRLVIAPSLPAERIVWFAVHGRVDPSAVLIEPMPYAAVPLSPVNEPPAMTRLPSGASTIDHTVPPSAVGFQVDDKAPVMELTAARLVRVLPLTEP